MRTYLLLFALLVLCCEKIVAQCDVINSLQIVESANHTVAANMECTDSEGWTHYFNTTENKLLLSIKKNGQNIGSTGVGLIVQSGTLNGFGSGNGFNLSNADYIANDVWIVANRFWQVTGANDITAPVQIRFYFSDVDVEDIAQSVDDFGFYVDEPDDVLAFTLSNGGGISPYAEITQPVSAVLTLYDMVSGPAPDWTSGSFNDFHYAEFEATDLDNAGSLGFLIFQADPTVSVSGNIARPGGMPISGVTVEAASTSIDETGADGNFSCPTLIAGGNYEVVPSKNVNPSEDISVADLIRLSRHLLNLEPLTSPYDFIAADADDDTAISFGDLDELRQIILGKIPSFQNSSWRFVRKDYVFPDPSDPFSPPFPESIQLTNLPGELDNQDFIGVKIGDLAEDNAGAPPALNPTFTLPIVNTCNPGDEIVFPLKVSDFQNIRGFQFTLEWNAEVMEYLGVENLNLPGFTQQNVGSVFSNEGRLSLVWFNPADPGSSLNDDEIVCEIRFVATGEFGEQTSLNFTSSIAEAVLLHQNLAQDDPTFITGSMVIENNSQLSANTDIVHAGCNGEPTGSINLTVNNAVPPVTFDWSNGDTTEDISNLPGGEYRVTVSDNSGNCPKVFFAHVAPTGPIEIDANVEGMSCPMIVDGNIQLLLDGGPFTFDWSNGENTQNIDGLFQGIYDVTVTDLAGCTTTASFEIENPNTIQPSVDIVNATSANGMDGALSITTIGGGTPPFTFIWNTGETTQSIQNLNPGDYIVTIMDGIGCNHVFGYIISDLMTVTGESDLISSVNIFPNPVSASQVFLLGLQSEKTAAMQVLLYSSAGRLTWEKTLDLQAGDSVREFPAPSVSGLYFMEIKIDGEPAGWAKIMVK